MPASRRILIAKLGAAHGVRGLLKINVFADDPATLNDYPAFFTAAHGDRQVKLKVRPFGGNGWLAEIDGLQGRTAAEALRGTELWLDRDQLPETGNENEFYVADLIGLQVVAPDQTPTGKIIAVDNFGAGDLLEIQPPAGTAFYVPFRKDYLKGVDLAAGIMIFVIPDELYEA